MTLREQIEALPTKAAQHSCWDDHEGGTDAEGNPTLHADGSPCRDRILWDGIDRAAVLDIIDQHECYDRDALARALNDAGLVARLTDYAMRAHPDTMARDEPNVAESWADAIIAALEADDAKD